MNTKRLVTLSCILALATALLAPTAYAKSRKGRRSGATAKQTASATKNEDSERAHRELTAKYGRRVIFQKTPVDPSKAPGAYSSSFNAKDDIYALALLSKSNIELKAEAYTIAIYMDDEDYARESVDLSFSGWDTNYLSIALLPSARTTDARALYQARTLCKILGFENETPHKLTVKIHPYMSGPGTDTRVVLAEGTFEFDARTAPDALYERCNELRTASEKHPFE